MYSSRYYKNKINKYNEIRKKIKSALTYFDDCYSNMNKASSYLQELIIDNKAFDDGKIKKEVNKLYKINEDLKTLLKECNSKINTYKKLYNKALAEEREAARSDE